MSNPERPESSLASQTPAALDEGVWQAWQSRKRVQEHDGFVIRVKFSVLASALVLLVAGWWLVRG